MVWRRVFMEEGVDRALACTATAGREAGAAVLSEAEIRQLYVEVKRVLLSQPKCTTSCASTPPSRSALISTNAPVFV
uniref:Uncharacterized protein n=1 Tax=Oryza meridionalis TaxID=40149 RepID=A0A0E0CFJ4_9ORYZ